jgi:hypothetical protein
MADMRAGVIVGEGAIASGLARRTVRRESAPGIWGCAPPEAWFVETLFVANREDDAVPERVPEGCLVLVPEGLPSGKGRDES